MEGRYFALAPMTVFVTGAKRGALYDLTAGDVYSVDDRGRSILEQTGRGIAIEAIKLEPDGARHSEVPDYLHQLEKMRLGGFRESPALRPAFARESVPRSDLRIGRLWLELTGACNLRCIHCYAEAPENAVCSGRLTASDYGSLMDGAARLGCRWIQLIGGEPLLYPKRDLFPLLERVRKQAYEVVEVFTNGWLLDDDHLAAFAANRVSVAVSLYSAKADVHDSITGRPGSFERVVKALERLTARGIDTRAGLILMKQNHGTEAETRTWLASCFPGVALSVDVVRCTAGGRADTRALLTRELILRHLRYNPNFPLVPEHTFAGRVHGHPCLAGSMCVHADGDVYPCIMDREQLLGHVPEQTLEQIASGDAARLVWGRCRDSVPVCRDCEFRYACSDCPPLARSFQDATTRRVRGRVPGNPLCLYDPYTGVWSDPDAFLEDLARAGLFGEFVS